MGRVIHFEIQAEDPERAAKFYRAVADWEIKEWVIPGVKMKDENRYWLVTTGPDNKPGINGGLVFRRGKAPAAGQPFNGYLCTISVANLEEAVDRVTKAGGKVTMPRMAIRSIGWYASCLDTEGNVFNLLQEDANVK